MRRRLCRPALQLQVTDCTHGRKYGRSFFEYWNRMYRTITCLQLFSVLRPNCQQARQVRSLHLPGGPNCDLLRLALLNYCRLLWNARIPPPPPSQQAWWREPSRTAPATSRCAPISSKPNQTKLTRNMLLWCRGSPLWDCCLAHQQCLPLPGSGLQYGFCQNTPARSPYFV